MMQLEDFAGRWRLARRIEDRLAGRDGSFVGAAEFTPCAEGLAYCEAGIMRLGNAAPMQASRRYLWCAGAGGFIEVRFEDGRFFHAFDPGEPQPSAHHDCPPDVYDVVYDFGAFPHWSSRWQVRGPRKDYVLESRYRRAPPLRPDAPA